MTHITMLNGILNIYKEKGYTSFDVVASLRKILGQRKIGHTGTLDPDAEGVLVVCLGKATKVVDLITDRTKSYRAKVLLGTVTDTLDTTGTVIESSPDIPDEACVCDVVYSFEGEIEQIPPMYSAIRVNGKHLYELARKGVEVERKSRKVEIHKIEPFDFELPYFSMDVTCSKGTYIRTLCDDIGRKLRCGGCMASLLRTRVGEFDIKDSLKLDDVRRLYESAELGRHLIGIDTLFLSYDKAVFDGEARKAADNGNALFSESVTVIGKDSAVEGQSVRMYDEAGMFYGIYQYDEASTLFKLKKFFKEDPDL